ncbi:hypothetical protein [Parasitella parasitica]|uniref:Zn(2)-C6 fungal-type domain-containing protein n=1 Tax=Parasitella parasitica TaxID=35722 RepID=A0A0B7N7F4_9FUNG|nr:hypothetical protein [Parasitella parasitica]
MKGRNIPCTECRKQRRKCVRLNINEECIRCRKFGKTCQQATSRQDEKSEAKQLYHYKDICVLQSQVKQLEDAIHYMEEQLNSYRLKNKLPEIANTMIQCLFHNWRLRIKNGSFQIETGIRNINELMHFNPNVSYLSPISYGSSRSSESNNEILLSFEKESSASLIPFTLKILARSLIDRTIGPPVSVLIPSLLLLDPELLVDQLIDIYFRCHNVYSPLVHENSHRNRLKTIQDPLTDLITLSICSYVCSTPCQHLLFSPREQRNMGDYFYAKAKDIILDQFDQPEKRLENAIAINLLMQYLQITLKFSESRQFVSMAYQILIDLRNDYPEFRITGSTDQETAALDHVAHQYPTTDIDKMLFTRHMTVSALTSRLLDFVASDSTNNSDFHFPIWKYVADEPDETKRFVESQNWIINLHNQGFVKNFLVNIHRIQLGKASSLSFESIVRMEQVMKEYTEVIPAELRLCDDLSDVKKCYDAIEQTTDSVLLVNFVQYHFLNIGIYSSFLQPKAVSDQSQQLLSLVQQHSLSESLKSARLLIHAIHRLAAADTKSCNYILSASKHFFHALDVLILLSLSPNKQISKEAGLMMKSCLEELDMIISTHGYQLPHIDSAFFATTADRFKVRNGTFDIGYYDQFPHPWFAMMHDASHFFTSR